MHAGMLQVGRDLPLADIPPPLVRPDYVQETFRPDLYAPGGVIRTIFELDEPCVPPTGLRSILGWHYWH